MTRPIPTCHPAIALAAFTTLLATPPNHASDEGTSARMDAATLRVLCLSEDGNELGTGSGFLIASGRNAGSSLIGGASFMQSTTLMTE